MSCVPGYTSTSYYSRISTLKRSILQTKRKRNIEYEEGKDGVRNANLGNVESNGGLLGTVDLELSDTVVVHHQVTVD